AARGRDQRRRHPSTHDRRVTADHVSPLLGGGDDAGARRRSQGRLGHAEMTRMESLEMATVRVDATTPDTETCTLAEFLGYFLRLGAFGFGGPIALAGYMQRDLVERRKWISKQDYVEGLALAQLAPGPL